MRNLKRALSLGLTAAMISGLMVMGSSAAGYADVTSEQNQEAIEVLQAVGIMVGDSDGNFNPDAQVTRNEMAVIMSNLMAYNVATYRDTSPFTDVPEWAEPYVAACYTNGITSGYDATTYGGNDSVTTAQAALMVMKALGYFQYQSDFGNDWQLATIAQGNRIDLFNDVNSPVREAMTRNDVAQLVLNALEAGTVEADAGSSITVGGVTITNDVKYNYITSGEDYAEAIDSNLSASTDATVPSGAIVQLGEKLYQGDLEKEPVADDFGRPATLWTYNSQEVGTFSDSADTSWTTTVSERTLYQSAGSAAYNNYAWSVYRNGEPVMEGVNGADVLAYGRTSNERWQNTGNGVLTEMFVSNTDESVIVTMIDTFVAEVTRVSDNGDGEYTVNISYRSGNPAGAETKFETEQEFTDGDIVLVTIGSKEIQTMAVAETVEGTVDAVKGSDYVSIDGTTYNYNRMYCVNVLSNSTAGLVDLDERDFVNPDTDNDVILYLDAYGNAVAIEGAEDSIDDYLYVTGIDQAYGDYSAKVVFADGTEETIDIDQVDDNDAAVDQTKNPDEPLNNRDSDYVATTNNLIVGRVYKWSQSGSSYDLESSQKTDSDGDPVFSEVIWKQDGSDDYTGFGSGVIERNKASITGAVSGTAIADGDTVYVHVDDSRLWTGYNNVTSMTGIYGAAVEDDDGVLTVMFIDDSYGSTTEDDDFVYISNIDETRFTSDGDTLYRYTGSYVSDNGELVEGEFVASSTSVNSTIDAEGLYYVVSRDSDDYATRVVKLVDVTNGQTYYNDSKTSPSAAGDLFDNYAIRANTLLILEGNTSGSDKSYDLANSNSDSTFSTDGDTFYMVVNLKGDNDDTDTVSAGSSSDINTNSSSGDNSDRSAVFVLTVDDTNDDTPKAEMVLVINPDPDAGNTPSGGGEEETDAYTSKITVAANGNATIRITDFQWPADEQNENAVITFNLEDEDGNIVNSEKLQITLENGVTSGYVTTNVEPYTASELTFVEESLVYNAAEITGIAVKTAPTKTEYISGTAFDATGLVLNVTYSNDEVVEVAYTEDNKDDFAFTGDGVLTSGNVTAAGNVTITYAEKTCTQAVTLATVESIALNTDEADVEYSTGETLDTTGVVVTATYSNGEDAEIEIGECTVTVGADADTQNGSTSSLAATDKVVVVEYEGQTAQYGITVA